MSQNLIPGVPLVFLLDLKHGCPLNLNTLVSKPWGKAWTVAPHVCVALPNSPCLISTWPLAFLNRVRNLPKPLPVPKLGQVLATVSRWSNVSFILFRVPRQVRTPLGARLLVSTRTRAVPSWVLIMVRKALPLREVHFPIAPIRPGTKLEWCRHRPLIPSYVASIDLLTPITLPQEATF